MDATLSARPRRIAEREVPQEPLTPAFTETETDSTLLDLFAPAFELAFVVPAHLGIEEEKPAEGESKKAEVDEANDTGEEEKEPEKEKIPQLTVPELRARCIEVLDGVRRTARRSGVAEGHARQAELAVVAFLDETVIGTPGDHRMEWISQPLQLVRFDRVDLGEAFFDELGRLQSERMIEPFRVYALCLALGFRGKYALGTEDALARMREEMIDSLADGPAGHDQPLSPSGDRTDSLQAVVRQQVPGWVFFALAAGLGFVLYVVLSVILSAEAAQVMDLLSTSSN